MTKTFTSLRQTRIIIACLFFTLAESSFADIVVPDVAPKVVESESPPIYPETERCVKDKGKFAGPYVGLTAGYRQAYARVTNTITSTFPLFILNANGQSTQINMSGRGAVGGALIGWGVQITPLYLGIEGEVLVENYNDSYSINTDSTYDIARHSFKAGTTRTYSGSLRFGFVTEDPLLMYIKIGAANTRWSFKTNYPFFAGAGAGFPSEFATVTVNKTGLLAGLGLEYKFTEGWIIGVEGTFTGFKTITYAHPQISTATINPCFVTLGVKLKYLF